MKKFIGPIFATIFLLIPLAIALYFGRYSPHKPKPVRFSIQKYVADDSMHYDVVITDTYTGCQYLASNGGVTAMPHTCMIDAERPK